jgi:hypothetical protein
MSSEDNFNPLVGLLRREKWLFILGIIILIFPISSIIPHVCLFEFTLGIQCPFCGLTEAFYVLCDGELKEAMNLNTALLPLLFFLLCSLINHTKLKSIANIILIVFLFIQFIQTNSFFG